MRRIAVIGTTGSGKTTLARQRARHLGIPHIEVDALFWEPDWTEAPLEVYRMRVDRALSGEAWVADGNLFRLQHPNLRQTDTAVWLDYPLWLIVWRLVWRTARRLVTREPLWSGNRERLRAVLGRDSLIAYALRTHRPRRRAYAVLFAQPQYAHLTLVRLRSPRATAAWLSSL